MSEKKKKAQEKEAIEYREAKETSKEAKSQGKPEVIDFTIDVTNRERQRNLAEVVGQTILVYDFNIQSTRLGPRAVISAEVDGEIQKLYTYSRVVIDQLERYKNAFREGKALRAKIEKRRRYITLAPP